MYYKRHLESVLEKLVKEFKTVLITGPRQVGKTTIIKEKYGNEYPYVTFDDYSLRDLAKNDPTLFMMNYNTKAIFDEIQYVPNLFQTIKMIVDQESINGRYLMTGSQAFHLMKNVSESLAGRIGIVDLYGFSMREIHNVEFNFPFVPKKEYINKRSEVIKPYGDVWNYIHRGSLPILNSTDNDWETTYSSYLKTYVERDVRDMINIGDEITFSRFMVAIASRSGQLLNYASVANDVGVSIPTVQRWLSILKASGLIYLLEPYHNNVLTRTVKTPKLYFLDTGFLAFLTKWSSPEVLKNGALAGNIFETFVVSEIIKSYSNSGKTLIPLYYYRDRDGKEIDLIIEENGILYPVEIKMTASPTLSMVKSFNVLNNVPNMQKGMGAIICMYPKKIFIKDDVLVLPIEYI